MKLTNSSLLELDTGFEPATLRLQITYSTD